MSDALTLDELKRLIIDQQQKIDRLENRVIVAEKQAEAAEQYSRQDCLILRGKLNIRPGHNFREEVMRIVRYHTGVSFPSWCLNTTHWLGNGKSIIMRFNNKAVRDEVYKNRVPKEVEKRGLFIHESLTASKMSLVARCAALRNTGKITTYYTQGGNVLVKRSKDSPSLLITPDMSDESIMTKLTNQPRTYREAVARGEQNQNQEPSGPHTTTGETTRTNTTTQSKAEDTVKGTEATEKQDKQETNTHEQQGANKPTQTSPEEQGIPEQGQSEKDNNMAMDKVEGQEKSKPSTRSSNTKTEKNTEQKGSSTKQHKTDTKKETQACKTPEGSKSSDEEKETSEEDKSSSHSPKQTKQKKKKKNPKSK